MSNRRRNGVSVPANYKELITPEQQDALHELEPLGWSISVVRHPKFEPVEVVLAHSDGKSYANLTEDGELSHQTRPKLRDDFVMPELPGSAGDPWANATDDMEFRIEETPEAYKTPTINHEPIPASHGVITKRNNKPPKDILV